MDDFNTYADTTKAPPASIRYDMQPYGEVVLEGLKWGEYKGFPTLSGRVVEGSTISRLGPCTSSRSAVGEFRTIYGVKAYEVERGRIVRIAC